MGAPIILRRQFRAPTTQYSAHSVSFLAGAVSCENCRHYVNIPRADWYCEAPELLEVLDDASGHQNAMATCQSAREMKHACGHNARWFIEREQ